MFGKQLYFHFLGLQPYMKSILPMTRPSERGPRKGSKVIERFSHGESKDNSKTVQVTGSSSSIYWDLHCIFIENSVLFGQRSRSSIRILFHRWTENNCDVFGKICTFILVESPIL